MMSKREAIDAILRLNPTAKPPFLAEFSLEDLQEYLRHLRAALTPRPLACLYGSTPQPVCLDAQEGAEGADEMQDAECPQGAMLF
jgi:hypothetical protein